MPPNTDSLSTGIPFLSEHGIRDFGSLDSIQRLVRWGSSSMATSLIFICHMSRGAEYFEIFTWMVATLRIYRSVAQVVNRSAFTLCLVTSIANECLYKVEGIEV